MRRYLTLITTDRDFQRVPDLRITLLARRPGTEFLAPDHGLARFV